MGGLALGKGNALGGINVLGLLLFAMLAACVIFQMWGYSFIDRVYTGVVALAGILTAAKMLASRYTARDLFVCVLLLGIGLLFALKARQYTVLLSAALLVAAKGVETCLLLTGFLGIKVFATVSHLRRCGGQIPQRRCQPATPPAHLCPLRWAAEGGWPR